MLLQVFWPVDDEWYLCTVKSYNEFNDRTTVIYDEDGMSEELDMSTEVYRLYGVAKSVPTRSYLQVCRRRQIRFVTLFTSLPSLPLLRLPSANPLFHSSSSLSCSLGRSSGKVSANGSPAKWFDSSREGARGRLCSCMKTGR
jgi:hypothetical protein